MNYSSLYRRMRPKTFDQIIGQDHITTALKNQVQSGKLGHAYLFSGTRGTGKTSTALVLAKAVNCLNPQNGNPCLTCENCKSEHSLDIIEMDAASNNSVDDIRDLREHVKFAPSSGRKKIYIIDEVHMLSQGAFNALLKTLEEPPEYVMFLLATTETHKVPMTIQSRCQKFEFKRIPPVGICNLLQQIVADLDAELSESAMNAIIASSDGALRDSLAALEQCMSVASGRIEEEDVHRVLGTVPQEDLLHLVASALTSDRLGVLDGVEAIAAQGKDFVQILSGLIDTARNVLVATVVDAHTELLQGSDAYREQLAQTAAVVDIQGTQRLFDALVALSQHLRYSRNKRALVEVTLLRASLAAAAPSQSDIAPQSEPHRAVAPRTEFVPPTSARPATAPSHSVAADETRSKPARQAQPTSKAPEATVAPKAGGRGTELSDEELWKCALDTLKSQNPSGWNLVRHSKVLIRSDNLIKIGVENLNKLAESAIHYQMRGEIESILHSISGREDRVRFERIEIAQETMQLEIDQVKSFFENKGESVDIVGSDSKS